MSQAVADKLATNGIQFASKEDAATAVLHLASDSSLNRRAVAVVTRDEDPRGYVDLGPWGGDDLEVSGDGSLVRLAKKVGGSGHRIGVK